MSRLRPLALAAFSVLALFAFNATATAASTTKLPSPVADCDANDGSLTHSYTTTELRNALKTISPSNKEYTTCATTIQNALNANLGVTPLNPPGSGTGGGGSGTLILIIVIVVVVLLGGGGAFWAYRRNQGSGGSEPDAPA